MTDHPHLFLFAEPHAFPHSLRQSLRPSFALVEVDRLPDAFAAIRGREAFIGAVLDARLVGDATDDLIVELRRAHGEHLPILVTAAAFRGALPRAPAFLSPHPIQARTLDSFQRRLCTHQADFEVLRIARRAQLSPREQACLLELARGRTRRAIARRLGVTPSTVATMLRRTRIKTDAPSIRELRERLPPT